MGRGYCLNGYVYPQPRSGRSQYWDVPVRLRICEPERAVSRRRSYGATAEGHLRSYCRRRTFAVWMRKYLLVVEPDEDTRDALCESLKDCRRPAALLPGFRKRCGAPSFGGAAVRRASGRRSARARFGPRPHGLDADAGWVRSFTLRYAAIFRLSAPAATNRQELALGRAQAANQRRQDV